MKNKKFLFLSLASIFSVAFGATQQAHFLPAQAVIEDRELVETSGTGISLNGDVSFNVIIETLDELKAFAQADKKPANVIFYINEAGAVTNSKGVSLEISYQTAFKSYLKNAMIPCFYIKDQATEEAFATYWNEEWKRIDIAIVSDNPAVLLKARQDLPAVRGILDYSQKNVTKENFKAMIAETHSSCANTLIINKNIANRETFEYFQARFKTVWVDDRGSSTLEFVNHISKGVYGCIIDKFDERLESLKIFNDTIYPKVNLNRIPFNAAHRGLPATNYENSLEGCVEAFEKGATHIEIDIQVTKDEKLAIMHDDTMDRTTNVEEVKGGSGYRISDFTAEELKQFKIDSTLSVKKSGPGVNIPMLDEVFDRFKGTGLVIIVEIKTGDSRAVELLKQYIEKADIADQVVVISFYTAQLTRMKEVIPYIPCADLNNYTISTLENNGLKSLNSNNFVIDTNSGNYSSKAVLAMAERGYASWYWTFDNLSAVYTAIKNGMVGLTNNLADTVGLCPTDLAIEDNIEATSIEELTVKGKIVDYAKNDRDPIDCIPFYTEKVSDTEYNVIFQGKYVSGTSTPKLNATVFSEVKKVKIVAKNPTDPKKDDEEEEKKTGCGGAVLGASALICGFAAAGAVLLSKKKKELDENEK